MLLRLPVAALLAVLPALAVDPAKIVNVGRGYQNTALPAFDKGYLLFTIHPATVEVWGPDGQIRFTATIDHPPGASVSSLAVDTDGSVAVGLAYPGTMGTTGAIALLNASGKQVRLIDTGKYMPAHVCFDAKHSLWTFGWQRDPATDSEARTDYRMFRKYSPDGLEAGQYVPRSSVAAGGLPPGAAQGGLWRLRVADDRVGALAYTGNTSATMNWIELGLDGRLIGTWNLGQDPHGGLAFSSDGRLCRQVPGELPSLECFDRNSGVWNSAGASPVRGLLLGADGAHFVFGRDEGTVRLYWTGVP